MNTLIQIEHLDKAYGNVPVLHDISLHVNEGEIYAIVGHSGAGKSTLLRCINGLETFQKGTLKVLGAEINTLSHKDLRDLRKDVGMIFQNFALMARKSVFENVAMPLHIHGIERVEIETRVKELLELVGLSEKRDAYPSELSGGQKQRVAIARALALRPKVLLSDEATSALDPKTTNGVLELLEKINRELNITIIVVTHEMDVVKKIAHKAVLLEDGKIIGEGSVESLFLKPGPRMRHFLGEEQYVSEKGITINLYFPKEVAQESIITHMARTLDIDFNIVWGKMERLNGHVLGHLAISVDPKDKENVITYLKQSGVLWEEA